MMLKRKPIPMWAVWPLLVLLLILNGGTAASPTAITFIDSGQSLGNEWSNDVALGDLDGDGDPDAFVANSQNLQIWLNQGGEQGGTPGTYALGGQNFGDIANLAVALGDLDGDTDLDAYVIRGGSVDSHQIWINQGGDQGGQAGTFLQSSHNVSDNKGNNVILGDVDGDNDLDAYIARLAATDTLFLNDGLGNLNDSGRVLEAGNSWDAALADLDGDTDLDLFVATEAANTVWINQGGTQGGIEGTYLDSGQQLGNSSSLGLALSDLDGDGDLDAFVANVIANKVWRNLGGAQSGTPGTFADTGQNLGFGSSQDVALADLDGDNDMDAFVANGDSNKVWLNQGGDQGGTASQFQDSGQNLGEDFSQAVALGDVDGDNDSDAFIANTTPGPNRVYLNFGGAASNWQIQTLDVRGNVGQYADVAVDSHGYPHISYYEQLPLSGRLKYAYWDGLSWQVEVVDATADVGRYSAITVDNNDRPHISYIDATNHRLKYARQTAVGWQIQTIPAGFANGHTDIAYHGRVHITFYGQTELLRHAEWDVTTWLFSDVDQSTFLASHSLALDSGGRPHVSYYNGNELRYATQVEMSWVHGPVGNTAVNGLYNAIALDNADQPHIAYIDPAGATLGYAFFDGFIWDTFDGMDIELADSRHVDIVKDNNGIFHIAYYRQGGLRLFSQVGVGATAWALETIDSNRVGQHLSLTWDIQDRPHVVYYDDRYEDLKYALVTDAWQVRQVETGGINGNAAQAIFAGTPAFAVQSAVTSPPNLYLAEWQNQLWQLAPVDVALQIDNGLDFAYDETGTPHIAYFQNGAVRHATWNGSAWTSAVVFNLPAAATLSPTMEMLITNGQPAIVYGYLQDGFGMIELARPQDGSWVRHALGLNAGWSEPPTVFAADVMAAGEVALTYFWPVSAGASFDTLFLARWDGTQWQQSVVAQDMVISAAAVAVDRRYSLNGTPEKIAVAYHDATNNQLHIATSTDGTYWSWQYETMANSLTQVDGLALDLAENAISQPRVAYINGSDNSIHLLSSETAVSNWTSTTLLPSGGVSRSRLTFDFGHRERLTYLEGTDIYHLFRTENRLVAPANDDNGSVPVSSVQNGELCALFVDPVTFCATFPNSIWCQGFSEEGMIANGRRLTSASGTSLFPGDIGVLADLTDLFLASNEGADFVNEYAQHDAEIGAILVSDAGLLWDGYRTLQNFMPGLEALTSGYGGQVTVTQEMVDNALDIWTRIAAAASPELAAVINDQLAQTNNLQDFAGMTFVEWAQSIGVNPPNNDLYLPIVNN